MNALKIVAQVLGIVVLIPAVAVATLRFEYRNADGPSVLFPGGRLVAGELYSGPEPDWRFTKDVATIELQLDDPLSSRTIFIIESDGKIYVPSGYMGSTLGRLWKHWAVDADEGSGLAVARIDGTRYERQLVRIKQGDVLDGVVAQMAAKYGGGGSREAIEQGDLWIFEMAPRGGK
jgi:hypothetical protein